MKLYLYFLFVVVPLQAHAADFSSTAAPRAPVFEQPAGTPALPLHWSGAHLGLISGYAIQNKGASCLDAADTCANDSISDIGAKPAGITAGFEAGYDLRLNSDVVLGIEADVSVVPMSKTVLEQEGVSYYHTSNSKFASFGTLRGRVGYVFASALVYATGGVAVAQVKDTYVSYNSDGTVFSNPDSGIISHSALKFGWVLGAGAEVALSKNWSVKNEYLHAQLAASTLDIGTAYYGDKTMTGYIFGKYRHNLDIFRTGLAYSF